VKVLAFRHVPFEPLGRIETVLESRGILFDYADLYRQTDPPGDPEDYDGLIFMGGPMSVNDGLPWLDREMAWISEAAHRGQPVLGICLGAQLTAKALGARVYANPVKEIGWFQVDFTTAARRDPVLREAGPRETVFHWHGETFDLPHGAVLLASSAACLHQAFRAGPNIYGLQFHLEVTPSMISAWCEEDANCADVRELEGPVDPAHNCARLGALSRSVFGSWCDMLVSAQWHARDL
jgi:GMP synthase-like glutamine amidotransferase